MRNSQEMHTPSCNPFCTPSTSARASRPRNRKQVLSTDEGIAVVPSTPLYESSADLSETFVSQDSANLHMNNMPNEVQDNQHDIRDGGPIDIIPEDPLEEFNKKREERRKEREMSCELITIYLIAFEPYRPILDVVNM